MGCRDGTSGVGVGGCPTGKLGYQSRKAAKLWSRRLRGGSATTTKLRSYKCPDCDYWHLTSESGCKARRHRRIRRRSIPVVPPEAE